ANAVRGVVLDLWLQVARSAPQIVAEPRHDERNRAAAGQFLAKALQRHRKIGLARGGVDVRRNVFPEPGRKVDRRRGQRVLTRPGDQRDTAYPAHQVGYGVDLPPLRRALHLERELRYTVAERAKIEVLEDHI